jgi:hypothetical protein
MKLSALGYTGTGAPVIEYTCPKISSADRADAKPISDHVGKYTKKFNKGNPGITDELLTADNANRSAAVVSAVAASYEDGELMKWCRFLKLPFDPRYARQLYASTTEWQGEDYKTACHVDFALELKGILRWHKVAVNVKSNTAWTWRFYKVFEMPVKVVNEEKAGTFHTPTRTTVDDIDSEFGADLAASGTAI